MASQIGPPTDKVVNNKLFYTRSTSICRSGNVERQMVGNGAYVHSFYVRYPTNTDFMQFKIMLPYVMCARKRRPYFSGQTRTDRSIYILWYVVSLRSPSYRARPMREKDSLAFPGKDSNLLKFHLHRRHTRGRIPQSTNCKKSRLSHDDLRRTPVR